MDYTTAPVKMQQAFEAAVPSCWMANGNVAGLFDRVGGRPGRASVELLGVAPGGRPVVSFECAVLSPRCRGWVYSLAWSLLLPHSGEGHGEPLGGFEKPSDVQHLYLRSVADFGSFFAGLEAIMDAPLDGTPEHQRLRPWAKLILAGPEHQWWPDYSVARVLAARVDSTSGPIDEWFRLNDDAEVLYGMLTQAEILNG